LIQGLVRAGECGAASALLFQAAGALRAAPPAHAAAAEQRFRLAANELRLYHCQLLAAYQSAREAVERSGEADGAPNDICSHLLCLADVHLEARDPIGALTPILRCLTISDSLRLLQHRSEALVRLAQVKLEMNDLLAALQLTEEALPQATAGGGVRLRGKTLMVQADILFSLAARNREDMTKVTRLLKQVGAVLETAIKDFEAVADLNPIRRCHYLLARCYHELGDQVGRDRHASRFMKISQYFDGKGTWADLQMPQAAPFPENLGGGGMDDVWPDSNTAGGASGSNQPRATSFTQDMQNPINVSSMEREAWEAREARAEMHLPFNRAVAAAGESLRLDARNDSGGGAAPTIKCPTLTQLLALAEAAHAGGSSGLSNSAGVQNGRNGDRGQNSTEGMPTVVGNIRSYYPLIAALGA